MGDSLILAGSSAMDDRPLRSGRIVSVSALPRLSGRQLARLDGQALKLKHGGTPDADPGIGRQAVRARGRALRVMRSIERRHDHDAKRRDRERRREDAVAGGDQLPLSHGLGGLLGVGHGMAGLNRVRVPSHSTSTLHAGVITPFLVCGDTLLDGPLIGMEYLTGTPFRFDSWAPYRARLATSVNAIILGMMGTGKSVCLKTMAVRECTWPRSPRGVIVQSDPKGEWAAVADAVGGQTVGVGGGNYLNPLDVGRRPDDMGEDEWRAECAAGRAVALRGLIISLREGRAPLDAEKAMISAACEAMGDGACEPTISGLVDLLASDWPDVASIRGLEPSLRRGTANGLIISLDELVSGSLRGAFERESTIDIDPMTPMLVFDTSTIPEADVIRRQVYTAAISAWIDRILSSHDGRFRIIIAEEGHEVLANPELVSSWERRMRLSGDWACSSWMLLHELSDLEKFGEAGSEQRQKIDGILTKSTIQVVYQQSPASMPYLTRVLGDVTEDERGVIGRLPQGVGLWRIGNTVRTLVKPLMGPDAYRVFDQSARRAG